jgi:4-amino-4-deoxy-L-arabinose transferase-like glycosyltransferase
MSNQRGSMTTGSFAAALFIGALLPRLYVAIAWTREPVWDGHYYDIGARSIAAGLGYVGLSGGAWCHYPVGYSGLLGLVYGVFGDGQYVGPVLNALLGALLCSSLYALARYAMSERRARVAGVLTALYPGLITYSALLMTEPVAALALVGAALLAARTRGSTRGMLAAGLLLGLGTLVRPQSILCAPALGLFALRGMSDAKARGRAWRAAGVASLVALLTVSPWTIRNCRVMDGCAFVSTNAGWNLAIGSFPGATGRFATLSGRDGCRIVTGQVQQDRCWLDLGVDWIADDPVRWAGLIPAKLGFTFDHESFPIGYLGEADPESWPEARRRQGRGILSWSYRAVLSLAALAMLPRPTRKQPLSLLPALGLALLVWFGMTTPSHPFWPVALVIVVAAGIRWRQLLRGAGVLAYAAIAIATVVITHAVFFGEDRYHMVITPLLCLLAAAAFPGPTEQAAQQR